MVETTDHPQRDIRGGHRRPVGFGPIHSYAVSSVETSDPSLLLTVGEREETFRELLQDAPSKYGTHVTTFRDGLRGNAT